MRHPADEHPYITTYSGKRVDSLAITPADVVPSDLTRGLAMQCRYRGMTHFFYSIAEHSVLVADLMRWGGHTVAAQRCGLLHDAHEAITGDMPSPFKTDVSGWRPWEDRIEAVVRSALGLPGQDDQVWESVKKYDLMALHFEASKLIPKTPPWVDQAQVQIVHDAGMRLYVHPWENVMLQFRMRANSLGLQGF